ncbi:MAG: PAS domain S-box protein [Flavobacteriales bacterium]|nr:PAS domain S-box protein [Flavobacteriales bacterium]
MELRSKKLKADINKYFNDFFSLSSDAYFLLSVDDMRIIDFNQKSINLFKITEDSIDTHFYDITNCDEKDQVSNDSLLEFKGLILSEGNFIYNRRTQDQNGNYFEGKFTFSLVNLNETSYFLVRIDDITEEVNDKIELLETKETYESIYHLLPDGIINHHNGNIITCNQSFLKYNNDTKSDIKGKHITSLFSEVDHQKIIDQINNPIKGDYIIVNRLLNDNKWHKFVLESFKTKYYNTDITTTIVSDYQLQEDLAKEQLRANLANEANVLLEKEIAKHKETQRKLEASQEISKSVFNSSIDTIISTDLDNKITEVSPSACYTFGYEATEFKGLNSKLIYADETDFLLISKSLKEDGFYIGEVVNKRKDGTVFTCFLSCAAMRNKKGEHIGYMGISRDITDIKKAEEELVNSEKKYRDLFVNLGDALVIVDANNTIIDRNNAAKKLFGQNNCLGKNLFDFVHPEDIIRIKEKSKEFREAGKIVNVEFRIINEIGTKYVTLSSTAIYENNTYIGSRDIIRDITQEKEYQQLIKNQTSHLQSIFENKSEVMMFTLDHNFTLNSYNSRLKDFFNKSLGLEMEDGMNFMDAILRFVSDQVKDNLLNLYSQTTFGKPNQFEGIVKNKDGVSICLQTFLSPIKVEGKERYDLAVMAMDITEKKESELELTRSLKEKEVLLKEVHHRVKNNLQVISSILNLQSSYVKDDNTLVILRESQNRVKSMSFIHESLYRSKDFSQVNFSDYMNNLINNVIHTFLLPDKDVMLITDLGAVNLNLDQAIPCGLVVNELLTNAMKYAFDGIENPTLEVKINEKDGQVNLWIEDNGIGLPRDFRIDESDSLGLQLVQTLVEQIDGTLTLKTENGTKYFLTFEKFNQP